MQCFVKSLVLTAALAAASTPCPFLQSQGVLPAGTRMRNPHTAKQRRLEASFGSADYVAVKLDIIALLANSSYDDGSYGPFLIRFAWHCAGTYRASDGRGGCDGARIRFEPESAWGDNNGLITPDPDGDTAAMALLAPIKERYGAGLSWGDLIVLAGSTAIEHMGGPQVKFCPGRVDAADGAESVPLNTSLIYVPADTEMSNAADLVRSTFAAMDMNDRETVALIGGGHAFGRCHLDRSGFDGPWTTTPTQWSNMYFTGLLNLNWTEVTVGNNAPQFSSGSLLMLRTDRVLLDDSAFRPIVEDFASNMGKLTAEFGAAWEKLMNRDGGDKPCAGEEPLAFQPAIDYDAVKAAVIELLDDDQRAMDFNNYGPLFVRFAWHCAGTYRSTDHRGGCNGAHILHRPQSAWGSNPGLVEPSQDAQDLLAYDILRPVKDRFGSALSWADLIIIAGTSALENMGVLGMSYCPGRVDDSPEEAVAGSAYLNEEIYLDAQTATAAQLKESMSIMGFTAREMVALVGGGHSIGKCHWSKSGFEGPWTTDPTVVSNGFFTTLLNTAWTNATVQQTGKWQFEGQIGEKTVIMLPSDVVLRDDNEFRGYVDMYVANNTLFLQDFAAAWVKLINADRWGSVCETLSFSEVEADAAVQLQPLAALVMALCFLAHELS